jgi:alpha-2-macroglobulin
VTPGTFTMPGAVAEDMYRPDTFARTVSRTITIAPRS